MSSRIAMTLCLLPLIAGGCNPFAMRGGKAARIQTVAAAEPTTQPVPTEPVNGPTPLKQLRKADFQGWHLTVMIDGRETQPAYREGTRQIWSAGVVSPTPKVEFVADRPYLGEFRDARLSLHAVRDGRVVVSELWQYVGEATLAPLNGIALNRLRRVADGEIAEHTALPPGQYRLTLHVRGEETWDRQYVDLDVKTH
jgi:hypothetical protein